MEEVNKATYIDENITGAEDATDGTGTAIKAFEPRKRIPRKYIVAGIVGLCLFLVQTACYAACLSLNKSWRAYDLTIDAIDGLFPFLPVFSVVYVLSFPYWIFVPMLAVKVGRERFCNYITTALISYAVGVVVFLAFPTTITRPEVTGDGFFSWLTRLVYQFDSPDDARNLLPSFHCLNSWLSFMCVRRQKSIHKLVRLFIFVMTILICLSTLFMKQHYILDFVSAVVLGEAVFFFAARFHLGRPFQRLFPE